MSQKKRSYEFRKQEPVAPKAVKKVETDEILSGTEKFEFLLGLHWKKIVAVVALIIVIVVTLIIVNFVRESQDLELRNQFADAQTIETLVPLIEQHGDHPAAVPAMLRLAEIYTNSKDFKLAADTYTKIFNTPAAAPVVRLRAGLSAAYLLETAGNDNDALAGFMAVVNAPESQNFVLFRQEAIYGAARLNVKAQKNDAALALLKQINYADTANRGLALTQCETLKKQLEAK